MKKKTIWNNQVYKYLCDYHQLLDSNKKYLKSGKEAEKVFKAIKKFEREFNKGSKPVGDK